MREFLIIAHRGASGYLPENTLEAAVMAHAMGADFIEMDVVITRDDVPVVYHDLYLDDLVEIPRNLAERKRKDGRHYLADFDWEEIKQLQVHPRICSTGESSCPEPPNHSEQPCCIASLDEMARTVKRLNKAAGRVAGLYIEPKAPSFHARAGKDVFRAVMESLQAHDLVGGSFPVYLQSFDPLALKQARSDYGSDLSLVQLIAERKGKGPNSPLEDEGLSEALAEISGFVSGIGPPVSRIFDSQGSATFGADLIEQAHDHGLFVHAWHGLEDRLPMPFNDMGGAVENFLRARLDGVFTDHPDLILEGLRGRLNTEGT